MTGKSEGVLIPPKLSEWQFGVAFRYDSCLETGFCEPFKYIIA
jgi:hypothetical protein